MVSSLTTKDALVSANPDGSLTAQLAAGPVREPNPSAPSGWSAIDLSLQQTASGIAPAVADADYTFSSGGTDPLVSLDAGNGQYALEWPGTLPTPLVTGSVATYPNVEGDMGLEVRAQTQGYSMSVVVPTRPEGPLEFALPLSLQNLSASVDGADQLILTDGSGSTVAQAAPATMWGAAIDPATGDPAIEEEVPISIVQTPSGPELRMAPDPAFFARPDLAYPVRIDPSPTLSVNVDTTIRNDMPDTSYAGVTDLKSGYTNGLIARSLLKFSSTGLLAQTQIVSATLNLYQNYAPSCTASQVVVYGLTGSFNASTTWNTRPTTGYMYASATAAHGGGTSCPADWVNLSTGGTANRVLADLVQTWADGSQAYGLEIRAANEADSNGWKKFSSADAGTNVPTLSVTYNTVFMDLSETGDGSSWWNDADPNGTWSTQPTSFDPYGLRDWVVRYDKSYTYKSFGDPEIPLYAYEFDPADTGVQTSYPALVLVHGGGWKSGVPGGLSQLADELRDGKQYTDAGITVDLTQKFIVIDIEYRLACNPADPNLAGTQILRLCGWKFDWPTDGTPKGGAAINDVEDAISWVRTKYQASDGWKPLSPNVTWNNKIAAIGTSAGGHLVAMAAALGTGNARPDAVATWSAPVRIEKTSNDHYGCDIGYSKKPSLCWKTTNRYLQCAVAAEADTNCESTTYTYAHASPYEQYDIDPVGGVGPPIFFANGGGGTSDPELIGVQEAKDFDVRLGVAVTHDMCLVDANEHASQYLEDSCDAGTAGTVLWRTVDFLRMRLAP